MGASMALAQGLVGMQGMLKSNDSPRTIFASQYFRDWPTVMLNHVPGGAQVERVRIANATAMCLHALGT